MPIQIATPIVQPAKAEAVYEAFSYSVWKFKHIINCGTGIAANGRGGTPVAEVGLLAGHLHPQWDAIGGS